VNAISRGFHVFLKGSEQIFLAGSGTMKGIFLGAVLSALVSAPAYATLFTLSGLGVDNAPISAGGAP